MSPLMLTVLVSSVSGYISGAIASGRVLLPNPLAALAGPRRLWQSAKRLSQMRLVLIKPEDTYEVHEFSAVKAAVIAAQHAAIDPLKNTEASAEAEKLVAPAVGAAAG